MEVERLDGGKKCQTRSQLMLLICNNVFSRRSLLNQPLPRPCTTKKAFHQF